VAVVGVEGGVPAVGCRVYLVLADQVMAVGVDVVDYSVDNLFDDLGVASWVPIVDEVARALAIDGLLDAVAVAIVDQRDVGSGCPRTLSEAVLAVVVVGAEELLRVESRWLRDGSVTGVAVVVVRVAVEPIVSVVAEGLVGDAEK